MKKICFLVLCVFTYVSQKAQCVNANSLYTTNITYNNAQANWISSPNAYNYKIHYRELGTTNWSNLGNIDSTMTSRLIPMLQPSTSYEWEIQAFCDSTMQNGSGWSHSDTFTTAVFIPSPFSPTIQPIIANNLCNTNTAFSIIAQQQQNEPDISTSIFFSDKGSFELGTINNGDTLGNANYSSPSNNFSSLLILDFKLGPNYAKIDMIDSTSNTMGFFIIENMNNGIKVTSIGPNDGNNYTNGYISQINFTDIFLNPNEEGPITFTADINSELGDIIQEIDSSIIISCPPTIITEEKESKSILKIVNLTGQIIKKENYKILIYIYNDGTIEKKIIIE